MSDSTNEAALNRWKSINGDDWEIIRKNGEPLTERDLKRGDIVIEYSGSVSTHVLLYVGDGKVSDCTSIPNKIHYGRSMDGDDPIKVAFRYTGGSKLKAYDKITTLETYSKNTGTKKNLPSHSGYAYQSFAFHGNSFYMQCPRRGSRGSDGYVFKFNKSMDEQGSAEDQPIGHANGFAYCTKDNKLYSTTTSGIRNNGVAQKIDPHTLKVVGEVSLPHRSSPLTG